MWGSAEFVDSLNFLSYQLTALSIVNLWQQKTTETPSQLWPGIAQTNYFSAQPEQTR